MVHCTVQDTLNDGIKLAGPNAEGALDKVGAGDPRNHHRSQVSTGTNQ